MDRTLPPKETFDVGATARPDVVTLANDGVIDVSIVRLDPFCVSEIFAPATTVIVPPGPMFATDEPTAAPPAASVVRFQPALAVLATAFSAD